MPSNPKISSITLPSGTVYDLKDAELTAIVAGIQTSVTGAMHYVGITSTELTDGSTTSPISIDGESLAPEPGAVAIYGEMEYVWSGSKWQEFGSTGSLKALAFKDTASAQYTPGGTVSQPTFSGDSNSVTVAIAKKADGNYEPTGTVTQPTFSGNELTSTGTFKPTGSVTVTTKTSTTKSAIVNAAASGAATYTPAGDITIAVGNGTANYTPDGSISVGTGSANYTPEGSVSTPTITVVPSTTDKFVASSATGGGSVVDGVAPTCTLPTWTATVSNENLALGWSEGSFTPGSPTAVTLPSFTSQTIATGITSATSTQPTFSGTGAELKFNGVGANLTGTFSGTGARLVTEDITIPSTFDASFTGGDGTVTVKGTPTGDVSQPTFVGEAVNITGTVTPTGTVTQPTFTGTQATITVS